MGQQINVPASGSIGHKREWLVTVKMQPPLQKLVLFLRLVGRGVGVLIYPDQHLLHSAVDDFLALLGHLRPQTLVIVNLHQGDRN